MKRFGAGMRLTVTIAACLLLGHGAIASAEDASVIRATRVDGSVTRNDRPLKEGDVIERDDKVVAAANAAAVLTWSNGTIVELYPESALVVRGVVWEADKKLERSLLTLQRGRIFAKAQVPEHLFDHFELIAGDTVIMSQGAEVAIRHDEGEKRTTVLVLIGGVIAENGGYRVRIDEGQQAALTSGIKSDPATLSRATSIAGAADRPLKSGSEPDLRTPIPDRIREALMKTSKRLGGSLLVDDDAGAPGGPLQVKIGGVRNRRGNAPYTVSLKAVVRGGSGRVKSVEWSLGDGNNVSGRDVMHTFTQGVYVVVVRVEDESGQKATAQLNISVEDQCGC